MADAKISALTTLTGANVSAAADYLAIVDTSATETKKILVSEAAIPILSSVKATQAQMESAASADAAVTPAVMVYAPSATKAWGLITSPTTVTASYPASGVSVANGSTGTYTVTHGQTFSSANYAVVVTGSASGDPLAIRISARDATTFTAVFKNSSSGTNVGVDTFNYSCFGDLT